MSQEIRGVDTCDDGWLVTVLVFVLVMMFSMGTPFGGAVQEWLHK